MVKGPAKLGCYVKSVKRNTSKVLSKYLFGLAVDLQHLCNFWGRADQQKVVIVKSLSTFGHFRNLITPFPVATSGWFSSGRVENILSSIYCGSRVI